MNKYLIIVLLIVLLCYFNVNREGFVAGVNSPYDLGVPLWKMFGYFWPSFPTRTRNMSYDLRGDIPIRPPIIAPGPFMNPPAVPIYNRPMIIMG